jgi:hypothetical protein
MIWFSHALWRGRKSLPPKRELRVPPVRCRPDVSHFAGELTLAVVTHFGEPRGHGSLRNRQEVGWSTMLFRRFLV